MPLTKVKVGDKIRVKRTAITKEFGVRCYHPYEKNLEKLWPGDVGEVVEYDGNGWKGMKAEFTHGRSTSLATLYSDSDEWEFEVDKLENFVKVKA